MIYAHGAGYPHLQQPSHHVSAQQQQQQQQPPPPQQQQNDLMPSHVRRKMKSGR